MLGAPLGPTLSGTLLSAGGGQSVDPDSQPSPHRPPTSAFPITEAALWPSSVSAEANYPSAFVGYFVVPRLLVPRLLLITTKREQGVCEGPGLGAWLQ